MKNANALNRRRFLKSGGLAVAAPMILPSGLFGRNAPSNRITLGFIGMGSQGRGRNLTTFLNQPDATVLAVCDVWKPAASQAKKQVDERYANNDCKTYQDFREVLDRKDLDGRRLLRQHQQL